MPPHPSGRAEKSAEPGNIQSCRHGHACARRNVLFGPLSCGGGRSLLHRPAISLDGYASIRCGEGGRQRSFQSATRHIRDRGRAGKRASRAGGTCHGMALLGFRFDTRAAEGTFNRSRAHCLGSDTYKTISAVSGSTSAVRREMPGSSAGSAGTRRGCCDRRLLSPRRVPVVQEMHRRVPWTVPVG
jgi:hypothetical protein